jgi:hypothetical protein
MKNITLIALLLCSLTTLFAQTPQKMSYQSVIRKADGSLVSNSSVKIKISILQGSASGTASYVETQTATTNLNGLATLEIGGGTPVTGTFSDINWGSGTYFIKTETDPTGGTNYTISGTSQLLSVPYALYAGNTQNKGKTSIILTGNITNEQAAAQIAAEFGPYTENIYIKNTTELTTVDLSMMTNIVNLTITENNNLATINLSGLTDIYDSFIIKNNNALITLSFPALKSKTPSYAGFKITNNTALTSISFPVLINSTDSGIDISSNTLLTSISFPVLINSGSLSIGFNEALTSISFPVLTMVSDGLYIAHSPLITSINFPNLTKLRLGLSITNCIKLTSIGIPSLQSTGIHTYFDNNALPSSQINTLLTKLLTIPPLSGKYISLSGQTPPAPPTGQGVTDKATLISNGNSVYTD